MIGTRSFEPIRQEPAVTYQVADSEGETGVAQRIVIVQTSALAKLIGRWQLDGDGAASVGPGRVVTSGGHLKTR